MSILNIFFLVAAIGVSGYFLGRARAKNVSGGDLSKLHSLPGYAGAYVFLWATIPSVLFLAAWLMAAPFMLENTVRTGFPQTEQDTSENNQNLSMGMVRSLAGGLREFSVDERLGLPKIFEEIGPKLNERGIVLGSNGQDFMIDAAYTLIALQDKSRFWLTVIAITTSFIGAVWALSRIAIRLRARNQVETIILAGLIAASSIAVLSTIGIFLSMVAESGRFFASVPPMEFLFGTVWDPRFAAADNPGATGQFGLIPLLAGTIYIALVAMIVAVPIGLFAAIYMAEYASSRTRAIVKPLLEVLAGIPTIVYGFFALVTVGPLLRDISAQIAGIATGDGASFIQAQSVLTAGLVMGVMLIPFVSSLSDDVITQVPASMREGSLGLGATRSETMVRVLLPAALPGIVGALLLTGSRAIGETMIVVLAAGVAARLTLNPFEPMTTVTVKIVNQLTGDLEFTSPQTLVAFALGMTLFFITLGLNVYALYIVRKYREQYE
ncbi:MAG TPA: phosphate ABC transporter permease subunit PstC [Rhodobacteraceae bacterium]|mgnify:CR=1 FL=1|jgi:phosphate transport system permease protein|nr:phosphate ABC transporter permease subunit PstC [Rhodobacter sp.]HBN32539.1 phosphate ABC transporter permease subunit PstC [Paracoccaceae bacterium]